MRKRILLAALMCVLIPLASYAIPIANLESSTDDPDGYSSSSSSSLVYIILSKGFSITPPSSNPPVLDVDKPSEPDSNKTSKTTMPSYTKPPVQSDTQLTPDDFTPSDTDNGYTENNGGNGLPAAPVPEPATMLLLGAGLMGVATLRKMF